MDNSWIKLYRKIVKSEFFHDTNALKLFIFLLASVDRTTGELKVSKHWTAGAVRLKPGTFYDTLKRLQDRYKILTITPNKNYTMVRLLNWTKYQSTEHNPTTEPNTTQTQPNTITRIKKRDIRDKSLMGIHPEEGKRYGEPEVNLILDAFKGNISHIPADRKPRSVAHNVRQLIHSFIKRNGDAFQRVRGVPLTFDYVHSRSWEWYMQKDYAPLTEKLEAFKSKMKVYLDDVESQLKKETEVYEQTAN